MADQQIQNNTTDELDEILVKEPDGTFRVVKVAAGQTTNKSTTLGVGSTPSVSAPLPRVEKLASATMVLGDDEAKELAAVAEKTKTFAAPVDDKSSEIARRAIAESGVVLADPSLMNRLLSILVSVVKEVRKELETRDLLMRTKEQGGLAMTMNEATRLLAFLKPPITKQGVVTGQAPSGPKPAPPLPPQPKAVIPPPAPVIPKAPPPLQGPKEPTRGVAPTPSVHVQQVRAPSQEGTRPPVETKPVVQDVSFTPKLMGPIDELTMNLAEWRRMAPTLKDRGTKIEEKLRLLEEESYADRLKGVAAWYASDVVCLYQDIGRESLANGKSVAVALADRTAKGLPTLTLEEFQSVAELNERLRF